MELKLKINSDIVGASASTLCTIHCLATPFLFFASACSQSCCSSAPKWWIWLDFAFLFISLFAILKSIKTTSKFWIKPALLISWVALFTFIFLEENTNIQFSNLFKYSAAFSLAVVHIYNLKYCQCKSDDCCISEN